MEGVSFVALSLKMATSLLSMLFSLERKKYCVREDILADTHAWLRVFPCCQQDSSVIGQIPIEICYRMHVDIGYRKEQETCRIDLKGP